MSSHGAHVPLAEVEPTGCMRGAEMKRDLNYSALGASGKQQHFEELAAIGVPLYESLWSVHSCMRGPILPHSRAAVPPDLQRWHVEC